MSSYTFPRLPQVNLDIAVEYLIQAPRITKEVAPMTWMYLDCPPDGEVMLVWQPSQLRTYAASDGYVWADAESAFSSEMRGYVGLSQSLPLIFGVNDNPSQTVEMYVHRSGFRPANEMYATHCRRRFRLTPSRDPNPNVPPPDQSLWIIHYSQTEPQNRFPTDRIQVTEQVRQSMHERAMLQKHGQLVRKEFMLRDSANWPTLHLPGNANSSYPQQLMGYPGDVISHMNRSQQAYMQRQQTGAAHPGVGPSPAKRPRQGASGHAHGSTTSIPMPNVSQDAAYDDDEGTSGGDYMDFLTPRDISFHRYIQHHEWLEEIISSPFDTSQIIPGQIGLGRKGELESLTRDFFDAPTETTAKEAFPQPDGNSPLKESATPRVGRLEPGKAEDFAKRATERVAEINAEMEKLRRQHVRRMAKLNKGQSFKDAEQNLRAITLEMINGDPSKSDAVQKHKVDELTKGLEARIGKTIRPLQEIECIEKGGLEEKSQAGDIQDKDHEMVDNFGRLDSAAPPTIPYTEHGTSASANQLSLTNDTAGFAQNHALTRDVTSQGDVSMSEAYESSGAKDAGTDDWIMVNKDGNSAVSHQHTPDLDDFGNDPTMQTFTNALNADKNVEGDEVQGFGHRAGDDNAETFVADDFDEGIDFGDLDTAGVEMSGYVQEMESAGLEGKSELPSNDNAFEEAFQDFRHKCCTRRSDP